MLTFVVYVGNDNQWHWRLFAGNNRVIADGGEGYHNQRDCEAAIDLIKKNASTAQVQVKTPR